MAADWNLSSPSSFELPSFDYGWSDLVSLAESLFSYLLTYIFIGLICYIISVWFDIYPKSRDDSLESGKRILYVIAHPDDECMFFGPSIVTLTEAKQDGVHLLCLSSGDYKNEGKIRSKELLASCLRLGIPSKNVLLLHNSFLPDDPNAFWDAERVANIILTHVETFEFDRIVTFDEDGVSGHNNHRSIYQAVLQLTSQKRLPTYCRAFSLDTVNVFRKYCGILDAFLSMLFSENLFIVGLSRRQRVMAAMQAHESQLVWFRRLYLIFSRYIVINDFSEVTDDFTLDLR